jgi:hypothetical protein
MKRYANCKCSKTSVIWISRFQTHGTENIVFGRAQNSCSVACLAADLYAKQEEQLQPLCSFIEYLQISQVNPTFQQTGEGSEAVNIPCLRALAKPLHIRKKNHLLVVVL